MPLFADIDSGWLCGAFIIFGIAVPAIMKAVKAAAKEREEANLKANHPEMWLRQQEMAHEKQMMEHNEKMMRHEGMRTGAGIIATILRIFTQ